MDNAQVDTLQSLQRGEISATETYQQAIEKLKGTGCAGTLESIHNEHRAAANSLRQHVRGAGGPSEKGSGVWGAFAKAVEGTAAALGETTALKALKEGEERGVKDYVAAVNDDSLSSDCRILIETELLPQTKAHVAALDRLLANLNA